LSRRKRGQESNGQTDVQEVNPPADLSADRENGRQDDLRKWLKGESNLLLWLDEEPTTLSSLFYSGETAAEEALLREKVAGCEEEIARLRDELSSRPAVDPAVMEENSRLKAELEKVAKSYEELKHRYEGSLQGGQMEPGLLEQRSAELKEWEEDLEKREKALGNGQGAINEAELESRFRSELKEKEQEFVKAEKELKTRIEELETDLEQKIFEHQMKEEGMKLSKLDGSEVDKEIEQKLKSVQTKEKQILDLETQVNRLKDDLEERNSELRKIKEVLDYKEEELARRDEDLQYREKRYSEEVRRLEEAKKENATIVDSESKKRLEALRSDVQKKEAELKAKEEYMAAKERELRRREQGIIEDEITKREEERVLELQQVKVKTGNPRLDDLLLGGIPFGANVLIYGPPFIGKETLVNQFMAEGLKKGVPCIWVLTDKTPANMREEMKLVLSGYEEYEELGLVKYVDSYSRSMGDTTQDKYTVYVDEPTAHDRISDSVDKIAKEFKAKHEYYRLGFRTVSTLVAYSDPNTAFRFLSPLCGRRKRDKAVSMFTIEKGVHSDQEIQMLGSIMDGMIDFKVDQLKTYFSVRGITDVQSRSYIKYNASRHGLSIGSFALDHIR